MDTFSSLDSSRARAYCACSKCGWGLFGHFCFSCLSFLFLSPSLWETARYGLKYCLKGPLSPKQPINQSAWSCRLAYNFKSQPNTCVIIETIYWMAFVPIKMRMVGWCDGPNLKSSEILCPSFIPAIWKTLQLKLKMLRKNFFPLLVYGMFCCHDNSSSEQICSKTICSRSPSPTILHIEFD